MAKQRYVIPGAEEAGGGAAPGSGAGGQGTAIDPSTAFDPNAAPIFAPALNTVIPSTPSTLNQQFQVPNTTGNYLNSVVTQAPNREAPVSPGVTLGPAQTVTAPVLGPAQQVSAPTLGAAIQAQLVNVGRVGRASASLAGPAVLAQDSALFRGAQEQALAHFGRLMRGEDSIAAIQAARAKDQAIASQMAMAASARPGMGAMAARTAAQNLGRIQGDLASRTLEAQLAERNAAGQLYGNMATQGRGQDLQLGMFNAGEQNTTGRLNAQLGTQTSIANAGYQTQGAIAQAQNANQVGMYNAGQQNQQNYNQANLTQNANLANASALNDFIKQNAANQLTAGTFNAGQQNQQAWNQGNLTQQNNALNTESQLTTQGQNDANLRFALEQQQARDFEQSRAMREYAQMMIQNNWHTMDDATKRYVANVMAEAQKSGQPKDWERVLSAITGGLAAAGPIIAAL